MVGVCADDGGAGDNGGIDGGTDGSCNGSCGESRSSH